MSAGLACLGRIQKYLECETRNDFRSVIQANEARLPSSTEKQASNPEKASATNVNPSAISIREGNYGWVPESMVLRDINVEFSSSALSKYP